MHKENLYADWLRHLKIGRKKESETRKDNKSVLRW